jgi:hypothetical protein
MEAKKGEVCVVSSIPNCDFCNQEGTKTPGPYDFKTRFGPWAHGCEDHWKLYRAFDSLGVGQAQIWITKDEEPKHAPGTLGAIMSSKTNRLNKELG